MKKLEAGQVWRCKVKCKCGRTIGWERRKIRCVGKAFVDWDMDIGDGTWSLKRSMATESFKRWIKRTGATLQETKP